MGSYGVRKTSLKVGFGTSIQQKQVGCGTRYRVVSTLVFIQRELLISETGIYKALRVVCQRGGGLQYYPRCCMRVPAYTV